MLAIWGLITILGMIVAIASRRVSPLVALFLFPVTACLAAGFGLRTAQFALSGLVSIAPVVAMFLFAILFFGVLTDAGTIEPFVKILLRGIGKNPVLIVPGTALLALLATPRRFRRSRFSGCDSHAAAAVSRTRDGSQDPGMRGIAGGRRELSAMDGTHNSRCQRTPHHSHSVVQASDSCSDRGPGLCFRCCRVSRAQREQAHWTDEFKVHADERDCDDRFSRFACSLCLQFDSRHSSARPGDQRQG